MNGADSSRSQVDQNVYRDVIGRFASGVTVITAAEQRQLYGTTASAVSSLSLEPPMLLVCLHRNSATGQVINRTGTFAVNILSEDQGDLAVHFATKGTNKFESVQHTLGQLNLPLISESHAQFECRVTETAIGGTHYVFLAEVVTAVAAPGAPLAYYRGSFGRFAEVRDDNAYLSLRQLVLERGLEINKTFSLDDLSTRLVAESSSVRYALARLTQEGLVTRFGPSEYMVTPIREQTVAEVLDARCAITLGVVDMVLDGITDEQVEQVRQAAELARPGHFTQNPAEDQQSQRAVVDFHESVIRLANNRTILDLFRSVQSTPVVMRIASRVDWSDMHAKWSEDRFRLVESLAARDRAAVTHEIQRYSDEVKETFIAYLRELGGEF